VRFAFDREAEETDRYDSQEATRSVDESAADRACGDGSSGWPWKSLRPIPAVAFESHRVPSGDASERRRSEASGDPARSWNQESDRSRRCGGQQARLRRVIYDRAYVWDRMVGVITFLHF